MLTELREIVSLAARALVLALTRRSPRQKRCIYLERRVDDGPDDPYQDIWTPRGTLQMRKARARRKR